MFQRVLQFHQRALAWSFQRPAALIGVCAVLILAGYFCYQSLGSDLLPEMDEGAFILDYFTPAGASLTETNRILQHVEQILQHTPEVLITSRRTGLEMGLAAVTEANRGDFTVRLKTDRSRSIEEVMDDVRQKIKSAEPALDIEFTQVLQDMIGDLSNSPEPIQIKLFSNDRNLLLSLGPACGTGDRQNPRGGRHAKRGGEHHQRAGDQLPDRSCLSRAAGVYADRDRGRRHLHPRRFANQ